MADVEARVADRERAETNVLELYGFPGEDHNTRDGLDLLLAMLDEIGIKALSDDAVIRLSQKHMAMDQRRAR